MEDYCKEKNIEYHKIPFYHSPRASFTAFLYSMLNILSKVLPISKDDIYDSIKEMEETGKEICSSNLSENNSSLSLAKRITGLPVIYYPWGLQAAAIRFKSSLQENAKIQALAEDVIEACHNGIVPWEKNSSNCPILIQVDNDYFKTKERWKIIKEYFNQNNIKYHEVFTDSGSILSKLINLIYRLDYASIYVAVMSGVDPGPVKSIDFIKSKL
jgi:glucose/mannose-6-phosphate isomerase